MNKLRSFFKKVSPTSKKVFGILAVAAIISQAIFSVGKISATSPRFNFLDGDYEMFRGANLTKQETVWKDPVSGDAGDTFKGIIYYHNGVPGEIATNTNVKVSIPAKTENKTATLSATISADNASAISDTVVDGQIIGQSGLTVNLDQDANLEFVDGSVRWYPNSLSGVNTTPVSLPGSQSGDSIVKAGGINLGDINGCWDYAGYIVFQFKAVKITTPGLTIDKTVRNVSAEEDSYVDSVNASKSDVVEYNIKVTNNGTADDPNTILRDALPSDLKYVAGSTQIARDGSSSFTSVLDTDANQMFASGWNLGTLSAGTTHSDVIRFRASAPATINAAKTVVNTAYATSGDLSANDPANVVLIATPQPYMVFHKGATNQTTGISATATTLHNREVLSTYARPGDTITYTLSAKNTGGATFEGFGMEDGIADVLEYADVISVSDGGSVVNGTSGNEAQLVRYPRVDVAPGETMTRTFTVKVKDSVPTNAQNGYHYDSEMYNQYGDEVIITLQIPAVMHLEKSVRNYTQNEANFVQSNEAIVGDTLEYIINFSNTGAGVAKDVVIRDILPANVSYISGSAVYSKNNGAEVTIGDDLIANGVAIGDYVKGEVGYIKLRAKTSVGIANGQTLINNSTLTYSGGSLADDAQTLVKVPVVSKPSLPKTGADTFVVFGLSALVALFITYRVAKIS